MVIPIYPVILIGHYQIRKKALKYLRKWNGTVCDLSPKSSVVSNNAYNF